MPHRSSNSIEMEPICVNACINWMNSICKRVWRTELISRANETNFCLFARIASINLWMKPKTMRATFRSWWFGRKGTEIEILWRNKELYWCKNTSNVVASWIQTNRWILQFAPSCCHKITHLNEWRAFGDGRVCIVNSFTRSHCILIWVSGVHLCWHRQQFHSLNSTKWATGRLFIVA